MTTSHNPDLNDASSSPPASAYQPNRLRWLLLLIGVLILVGAIATVRYWILNRPIPIPRPPQQTLSLVETIPVTLASNAVVIRAYGFVSAQKTANITPQVSGKIIRISPALLTGERVSEGQMLVQLGTSDYQAALAEAQAALATAQSHYAQEQGQSRQAARDVERLGLNATDLNLRKPQLAAAKAAVDNAQAQVELAQINLNRTTLTAPFDAIVQSTDAALGEVANSNTILASLVATHVYTVKLTLDSKALKLINIGDPVVLTDPVYDIVREGRISRFDPGFDSQNRTIGVYVDIDKPLTGAKPLLLQTYLQADITGNSVIDSAWIPNNTIINGSTVWEKLADDSINPVDISIIYRGQNESLVTFTSPVTTLIIRPKDNFIKGQKVTTGNLIRQLPPSQDEGSQEVDDNSDDNSGEQPAV